VNRRLSSVTTSDGEGSVSYLYDAFGRATRATGSAVRYDYARDAIGRTTSEVRRTGGFHPSIVSTLSRSFDSCGRPAGLGLIFYGDFKQGVCYTWGMEGKLQGMVCSNAQGRAVEVSFDWEGGRGVGWSAEGLGNCPAYFRQGFGRAARRPALVTSCQAGRGGFHNPSRSFSYAYDAVGRPVERDADAFVYNARGEVTNAIVGTGTWRYAYDHIGNRQSAYEAGVSTSYSANEVNQYTEVGIDEPEYDEDGNLVDDGTRTFEWSAAGHLVNRSSCTPPDCRFPAATPSRRYECVYDHLGRRVKRTEYRRSGNNWYWVEDRDYVYDGWNLVFEYRDHTSEGEAELAYYWGPDLSGTLQGAGGVGGLVAVSVDGSFYFPGYDNNGNVVGYWDESGSLVAEYAYDAFGNTISSSGTLALASDIPTVADWAKAANKPTYTAAEVGAIPTTGGVFNASLHLNQKLSVGTWTSSVKPYDISGGSGIAFVFGDNVHTKQSNTMTLGVGALNTNAWSFIWNGDADRMYMPGFPAMSNPYATRYNGGFHVNPSVRTGMVNPLQNFWIGDTNLNDWIATLAPPTDLSGVVSKSGDTMRGDLELAGGSLSFRPSSGLLGGTCVTFSASGIETSTGGLSLGKFTYPDASGQLAIVSDIPTNAADIGALPISGGTMTGNLEIGYNSLFQINGGGNAKFQFSWGSALDNLIIKAYKETSGSYNIRFPTSEGLLALTSDIPTSMAWDAITSKPTFATVATSGAYSDLSGTPTLAAVATSGAYSDLSGKPTIPTVNNTTITLKQGENVLGTFTVNSATNATITIPPADTAAFEARMQVLESRAYIAIEGDAIYLVDPTENQ